MTQEVVLQDKETKLTFKKISRFGLEIKLEQGAVAITVTTTAGPGRNVTLVNELLGPEEEREGEGFPLGFQQIWSVDAVQGLKLDSDPWDEMPLSLMDMPELGVRFGVTAVLGVAQDPILGLGWRVVSQASTWNLSHRIWREADEEELSLYEVVIPARSSEVWKLVAQLANWYGW